MDIGPDANKFNRAKDIEGTDLRIAGGPNFRHLTINGTSPNLQDVRVRRALAMAISRQAIARALLAPLGIKAEPLDNHIFMANQAGYRSNAGEIGTYNPDKARQLLDEAGWVLDGDVRKKDGRPLELVAVIPAAVATSKQETELMQNMLAQVGVKLALSVVPSPDFFSKYITPGQFDFTVFSWMGTPYPMSSARSLYAMPTKNADGELDVQQNYARIGTPEIDELFERTNQELDPEQGRRTREPAGRTHLAGSAFAGAVSATGTLCVQAHSGELRRVRLRELDLSGHRVGEGGQETNVRQEGKRQKGKVPSLRLSAFLPFCLT